MTLLQAEPSIVKYVCQVVVLFIMCPIIIVMYYDLFILIYCFLINITFSHVYLRLYSLHTFLFVIIEEA